MKKYKIIKGDSIDFGLCKVFRIQALIDFGDVKAGAIGGYIESEANLSHQGNAWVADEAQVTGNVQIAGNTLVCDFAWVSGDGKIKGDSIIGGWAELKLDSNLNGNIFVITAPPDRGPIPSRI